MGRPRVRDEDVSKEVREMRTLFGTPKTAYENTRLEQIGVPWDAFSYAWTHGRATKAVAAAIEHAWAAYWLALKETPRPEDLASFEPHPATFERAQYFYEQLLTPDDE